MTRAVFRAFFVVATICVLCRCDLPFKAGPSVLVIGVEGLGNEQLSCDAEFGEEPGYEGLQALCAESVRFSHAFAPSTMSQANLASLLTGLYPIDHGVRDNGANFLSAKQRTAAEAALTRRYRTLFVSGGPPIWRKSGLAQGFEVFDDLVDVAPGVYYRRADEVFREARRWLDHEVGNYPFLSVLYLADLQFPGVATKTNEGVVREKSAAAQLEEIIESLDDLVRALKSRKRWNNTNVVLVGLSALDAAVNAGGDFGREPGPLSLKSDRLQVSLLIKPARQERDNVISWAVDRNVSLVDVGRTMFEWLGQEPPAASLAAAQAISLAPALISSEPAWEEDRLILSETGWPEWRDQAGIRFAVRQNQFLFVNDRRPLIFNTLTDRMENLNLKATDPLWTSLNGDVLDLLSDPRTPKFNGVRAGLLEQLDVAGELWRDGRADRRVRAAAKEPWAKWYLRFAVARRDWREVRRLAGELNEPVGTFVAAKQLGEGSPTPRDACFRLVMPPKNDRRDYRPECEDERVLALYSWQTAKGEDERQWALERFARAFAPSWIDQDVGRLNLLGGLRWDVDRRFPEAPSTIEYLLTLKEFEPFAKKALGGLGGLSGKDARF